MRPFTYWLEGNLNMLKPIFNGMQCQYSGIHSFATVIFVWIFDGHVWLWVTSRTKDFVVKLKCSRKEELEKLECERKAEKERQEAVERQARLNCQKQDDDRRQKILAKIEEIQQREIKDNFKVIAVTFYSHPMITEWVSLVIELVHTKQLLHLVSRTAAFDHGTLRVLVLMCCMNYIYLHTRNYKLVHKVYLREEGYCCYSVKLNQCLWHC